MTQRRFCWETPHAEPLFPSAPRAYHIKGLILSMVAAEPRWCVQVELIWASL